MAAVRDMANKKTNDEDAATTTCQRRRLPPSEKICGPTAIRNELKKRASIALPTNLVPTVCPGVMKNREIKRRTGFNSEKDMFSYIGVISNGDINKMQEKSTMLTWYEEWFLFFEYLWGRTHSRLEDLAAIYRIHSGKRMIYKIIQQKMEMVLSCRDSWPTYVSFEEDKELRDEKWDLKYNGLRIVMWDDTNVPFNFKPSGALNQRITFSSYYAMNCAKGGVFLQLCGWLGVGELWVGATSDSFYMEKANDILQRQEHFAKKDLVNGEYIPFGNILDKGYRIVRTAFKFGKQTCIQPMFAESDVTFTSNEMNYSASVAADRSGNERAVHLAKLSGSVKRGLYPRSSPAHMNNIWEAWSFQTNFMYAPVL